MAQSPCHGAAFASSTDDRDTADMQMMFNPYSREGQSFSKVPGISIVGYPIFPKSTGTIQIGSADHKVPARITPNYLTHPHDRKVSVAAVRKIREIVAQQPFADKIVKELSPTADAHSDEEILNIYQQNGMPGFHTTGTCAMGTGGSAVVDARTRVHGVTGLRVIDCSIYPEMICGVTNASIMAIAMRAAQLIIEDNQPASQLAD